MSESPHGRDPRLHEESGLRPRDFQERDRQRHSPVVAHSKRTHSKAWLKALFRHKEPGATAADAADGAAQATEADAHPPGGDGHQHPPHQHEHSRHEGDGHGNHDGGGHGHHALFHVHGPGGHIAVFDDRIEIHRHGLLHILLEILLYYEGSTELTLPIPQITAVSLVEPLLFPGYIRFYFAGSPNYSKDYWTDAMAPNTMLMPYFDHRAFHRLRDFILAKQARGKPARTGH